MHKKIMLNLKEVLRDIMGKEKSRGIAVPQMNGFQSCLSNRFQNDSKDDTKLPVGGAQVHNCTDNYRTAVLQTETFRLFLFSFFPWITYDIYQ